MADERLRRLRRAFVSDAIGWPDYFHQLEWYKAKGVASSEEMRIALDDGYLLGELTLDQYCNRNEFMRVQSNGVYGLPKQRTIIQEELIKAAGYEASSTNEDHGSYFRCDDVMVLCESIPDAMLCFGKQRPKSYIPAFTAVLQREARPLCCIGELTTTFDRAHAFSWDDLTRETILRRSLEAQQRKRDR